MFEHAKNKGLSPDLAAQPVPTTVLALSLSLVIVLAMGLGFLTVVGAVIAACVNAEARNWVERKMGWLAVRPLPAIHFIDVIAVASVTFALQPISMIFLHSIFDFRGRGIITPVLMLANDISMACAIVCAIFIAWWRARGLHGALGFWPAWSNAFVSPVRPIWKDILLGVACYPLFNWLVAAAALLSKFLVNDPDKHVLVYELARHPPPIAAAIFVFSATFGAAFFEETIFRGMMYNSLRRWLGRYTGGLVGAFAFAAAHGLKSDLLGLFVLGLVLTWLYDKTGRLIAGMAFHFTNNLVSLVMLLVLYNQ
jgi:membrane protease YdiL (CAAX protease family)